MYESGKKYRRGSVEEQIVFYVVNNQRMMKVVEAMFHVVAPDKANQLLRTYRGYVFPEEKFDDLKQIKRAREIFKKLRTMNFYVTPVGRPLLKRR